MNAHVNLGALWCTRPAGKVGAEPVLSTPQKSPVEEGVITAEFAVALPAVTVVLALCLGAASTGVAQLKVEESARTAARAAARGGFRGADSLRSQPHRSGAECADFRFS